MRKTSFIEVLIQFEGEPEDRLRQGEVEEPEREVRGYIEDVLHALYERRVIEYYEVRFKP